MTRIRLFCLMLCLPSILLVGVLLWRQQASPAVAIGALALAGLGLLLVASLLIEEITRPLQTLSNVVAALREEDYSFRARAASPDDALGELSIEVNALADTLQSQRLGALEATALLRLVITAMDAPVLAFDREGVLRLLNPAAERVLGLVAVRDVGRTAVELHLGNMLETPDESILALGAPSQPARWMVRRNSFRQRGVPHTLLVLSDVSSALREEERTAWRKLIRVLGHEISNSLAPIKSIAGSLRSRLPANGGGLAQTADFERGLNVIEGRAESLNRFVQAYRQLAQLPAPVLRRVPLQPLLERIIGLETRIHVTLRAAAEEMKLLADPDQVEQLLINILRNAVEAALSARAESEQGGARRDAAEVTVSVTRTHGSATILIEDNGPGLTNPANLFVPFYTTKPSGSGVGLVLARQIAEAHGGSVDLHNRADVPGCRAEVRLPLATQHAQTAG